MIVPICVLRSDRGCGNRSRGARAPEGRGNVRCGPAAGPSLLEVESCPPPLPPPFLHNRPPQCVHTSGEELADHYTHTHLWVRKGALVTAVVRLETNRCQLRGSGATARRQRRHTHAHTAGTPHWEPQRLIKLNLALWEKVLPIVDLKQARAANDGAVGVCAHKRSKVRACHCLLQYRGLFDVSAGGAYGGNNNLPVC